MERSRQLPCERKEGVQQLNSERVALTPNCCVVLRKALDAVEDPELVDLIAFRTDDPGCWWYRNGELGLVLGEDRYLAAIEAGASLRLFDSPLAWLRGGCAGAVFLDDVEARWSAERCAEDAVALTDWWRAAL